MHGPACIFWANRTAFSLSCRRFPGPGGIPRLSLPAAPGESSGWVEAGSRLDTLNDGEWGLQVRPHRRSRKRGTENLKLTGLTHNFPVDPAF